MFVLFHAEEIKTLKQQVVSLRTHLKSRADEVEQYKVCEVYLVQRLHVEFMDNSFYIKQGVLGLVIVVSGNNRQTTMYIYGTLEELELQCVSCANCY